MVMPVCSCVSGLVATVVATLLLLPVQYIVPGLYPRLAKQHSALPSQSTPPPTPGPFAFFFGHIPLLDIMVPVTMLMLGLVIYLCEWVEMKLMERRIVKLNQTLGASVEKLRELDAQQDEMEAELKMVQDVTSEYNLLLYLLQHRGLHSHNSPSSDYLEEGLEHVITF